TAQLFALRFASLRARWLEQVLFISVLIVSVFSIPWWLRQVDMVVLQHAATAIVATVGTAWLGWLAWRERRTELRLMA
ncbi:hypothetical protein Q6264_31595, partial [Klebsiella pneumoniae]|uniref:hypothetical protein n=1 Tax=Klebsiella pneumoniae TaxID=573 RepID=UPI00272FB95B